MTRDERRALAEARRRMLRLLVEIDENAEAASLPHWPQITASRLREVARLCLAQCFILEQKEDRHVKG